MMKITDWFVLFNKLKIIYKFFFQQYSDDSGSEPDVQLENQYYAAKGLKSDGDIFEALTAFQRVLDLETEKGDWGFKALKQMVKITFNMVYFYKKNII